MPLTSRNETQSNKSERRVRKLATVTAAVCCAAVTHCSSAFSFDRHGTAATTTSDGAAFFRGDRTTHRSLRLAMASVSNNNSDSESHKDNSGSSGGSKNKLNKKRVLSITDSSNGRSGPSRIELELRSRMTKLEALVAKQEIEIQQLKQQCTQLADIASALGRVLDVLQQEAGVDTSSSNNPMLPDEEESNETNRSQQEGKEVSNHQDLEGSPKLKDVDASTVEFFDDSDIFGRAPSSVIEAADAAGAAILAGMLGGKQRMLVDVRDAELSRDPETLVQFIELAILPVAAGLEGLKSTRNRVKIVFPTVSQLLEYRRTMALSAPEVVALSTLGFDPVEKMDNIVVLVAPSPDDEDGLLAMNELLEPAAASDPSRMPIDQPLVVLNYHMVPPEGLAARFEVAYHLRLLTVQFITGNHAPDYFQKWEDEVVKRQGKDEDVLSSNVLYGPDGKVLPRSPDSAGSETEKETDSEEDVPEQEDAALEAAMKHAHDIGINQGVTRAMVIRAYPRPWHVFVDTSPDTDADFEVAATFDEEPSQEDINYAVVECLEGSEIEDELVAQQMQQALEAGQLDRVSEMLEQISGMDFADESDGSKRIDSDENDDKDEDSSDSPSENGGDADAGDKNR